MAMPRDPLCVGVIGPVGAGKSSVLEWCRDRGADVADSDRLVHAVLDNPELQAAVAARFGASMLRAGGVDRAALAGAAFASASSMHDLEVLVHPHVEERLAEWLTTVRGTVAFVEGVKLLASSFRSRCGLIWLVWADRDVRAQRLAGRGWSAEEIAARMSLTPNPGPELAAADVVIDNSGPWKHTEVQLAAAWNRHLPKG